MRECLGLTASHDISTRGRGERSMFDKQLGVTTYNWGFYSMYFNVHVMYFNVIQCHSMS